MKFKSIAIPPALLAHRALRIAGVLALTAAASCGWMAWRAERAYATDNEPDATDRSAYSQTVKEHYNSRFGVDQPFSPPMLSRTQASSSIQKLSHSKILRPLPSGSAR